jgi:hypothetical protein
VRVRLRLGRLRVLLELVAEYVDGRCIRGCAAE